jgi:Domain of unknown function (DUF4111)/Nucleotidyltransferase domain
LSLPTDRKPVDGPTEFPELNDVLRDLVASAREILGDSMAGAYLQGSFALGDADIDSDCDFLIPLERPVSEQQEHDLRGLHSDIPIRPGHWTRHLEGSYPPIGRLATLGGLGESWLYIDHGWREMQWSTHCNTEVVRWTLREHGVTLAGPDPQTFMDEISPDLLRSRMRRDVTTYLTDLEGWVSLDIAWAQRYAVTTLCRIAFTAEHGTVASKRTALLWARTAFGPRWSPLIDAVLADRPLGFDPATAPRPGSVTETRVLNEYVVDRVTGTSHASASTT